MSAKGKRRPRRGRDFWTQLIAKYESRPVAQVAFVTEHGVALTTFRAWLYRLRAERRETSEVVLAQRRFVEVVADGQTTERRAGGSCRVTLGAASVEFATAPSAAYLAELLLRATR